MPIGFAYPKLWLKLIKEADKKLTAGFGLEDLIGKIPDPPKYKRTNLSEMFAESAKNAFIALVNDRVEQQSVQNSVSMIIDRKEEV